MSLCLRGTVRPLLLQLRKAAPFCGRSLFAPVAARCHGRPLLLGPAAVLQTAASSAGLRLNLHTSSQRQKRRRGGEESILRTKVRYHWLEIRKTPRAAFILALAGSAPFVTSPLLLLSFYHPDLPTLQVLHGACVLSFLGGVRWGYSLPDNSPAKLGWGNLLTGALFPYMALTSLLFREDVGVAMLGVGLGLGLSLALDVVGFRDLDVAPISPLWYRWLRGGLTVIAIASFVATVLILNFRHGVWTTNQNAPKENPETSRRT